MELKTIIRYGVLGLLLAGCKFEGSITDLAPQLPSLGHDFKNSYIETPDRGLADGSSILDVSIFLIDADGTRVSGFTPTINASMSGLIPLGCSESDSQGKSLCRFKSSDAGSFILAISNIGLGLSKQVVFDPIRMLRPMVGVASGGAQKMTGPGGWSVSGTVGSPTSGTVLTDAAGWKVYVDVQGGLSSQ